MERKILRPATTTELDLQFKKLLCSEEYFFHGSPYDFDRVKIT